MFRKVGAPDFKKKRRRKKKEKIRLQLIQFDAIDTRTCYDICHTNYYFLRLLHVLHPYVCYSLHFMLLLPASSTVTPTRPTIFFTVWRRVLQTCRDENTYVIPPSSSWRSRGPCGLNTQSAPTQLTPFPCHLHGILPSSS